MMIFHSYIRVDVISHGGDGHQAPPEALGERPGGVHLDKDGPGHQDKINEVFIRKTCSLRISLFFTCKSNVSCEIILTVMTKFTALTLLTDSSMCAITIGFTT